MDDGSSLICKRLHAGYSENKVWAVEVGDKQVCREI
jgi:hypothetical protein